MIVITLLNNDKPVKELSNQLDGAVEYEAELDKIKQAKADKVIDKLMKERARHRNAAISSVAKAACSAVVDNCVDATKKNIDAQFENAVRLAKSTQDRLVAQGRNPQEKAKDYKELVELVLKGLKEDEYRLSKIKEGTDSIPSSAEKMKEGTLAGIKSLLEISKEKLTPEQQEVVAELGQLVTASS